MTYKRAFLLTAAAYLASLAVYLLTNGEADPPTEKQTVIATQPGEGRPREAGEGDEITSDTATISPRTGGTYEH